MTENNHILEYLHSTWLQVFIKLDRPMIAILMMKDLFVHASLKLRTKEERPKDTCQKAGENLGIIPVSRRIADSGKWNFDVSKYRMHLASFKHPLSSRAVPW